MTREVKNGKWITLQYPREEYTCNRCKDKDICPASWGPYNTNNNCLAEEIKANETNTK